MLDNEKSLNERIAEFARSIANEAGIDPAAVAAQVSAAIQQAGPPPAEPVKPAEAGPPPVANDAPALAAGEVAIDPIDVVEFDADRFQYPEPNAHMEWRGEMAADATMAHVIHSDEVDPREANHLAGLMKRVLEAEWAEITGPLNKLIGEVDAAIAVASDPRAPQSQREKALGNAQGLSEQIGEVWMRIEREGHAARLLTTFDNSVALPTPKIAAIRDSLQAMVAPPPELARIHRRLDDLTHEMRHGREINATIARRIERDAAEVDYSPRLSM